ncbi:MAG: hypothetical protein MJE68_32385 [Proteobacteria bacterium]|nr:hypothetical protein [Pseudomonadota bacterium]
MSSTKAPLSAIKGDYSHHYQHSAETKTVSANFKEIAHEEAPRIAE